MLWKFRNHGFDLSLRGAIMGIVNVTPDSFSDGGAFLDPLAACEHGLKLLEEGALLLDVGGESTRPGALPVSAEEELRRVLPVIKSLRARTNAPISVDTSKPTVAEACLGEGADIINDVTALSGDPRMGKVVAENRAGLILMHMQGTPETMQADPSYPQDDVVNYVAKYLSGRREAALSYGVDSASIILDPGLGFGKTVEHNLALIRGIPRFMEIGSPILLGHSRKSFLGKVSGGEDGITTGNRLSSGLALTAIARSLGARLFRVHEVQPHLEALRMAEALVGNR
ncbi:MAG: dihydropteroate synthase [Verrucomicrobia bacterium]|nr:dihydropteroate synthase [Verrucomicrobiota bacterium]